MRKSVGLTDDGEGRVAQVTVAPPRRVGPRPGTGIPHHPALDGLRAVAVLAVLAYHASAGVADGGFLGVEVFFTLSGYLVTSLLVAESRRRGRIGLGRFLVSRARRLVPALVACIAGTVGAVALLDPPAADRLRGEALASLAYVQNWHLVLGDVPYGAAFDDPSPLLHLWSLAVEGQLYLVWPLLFLALLKLGGGRAAVVVLVLAAGSAATMAVLVDLDAPGRVYYGTDTRASGFLIGAALALAWTPPRGYWRTWALRARDVLGGTALLALLAAFVFVSEFDERLYRGGFAAVGVGTAAVVAAAAQPAGATARLLSAKPLTWLGQRSYGVYLYHWPIFVWAVPLAEGRPWAEVLSVDLAAVAATLLVAAASYRWLELPIRRGPRRAPRPAETRRPAAAGLLAAAAVTVGVLGLAPLVRLGPAPVPAPQPTIPEATTAPAPATPAPRAPIPTAPATPQPTAPRQVLVVGDSVVLSSADALRVALGPGTTVDGEVGRQFSAAPAIVRAWAARHPGPVVVHLGSNGIVREADVEALVAAAGARRVVLVNVAVPRRWQKPDNETLAAVAARHPGRVALVDWAALVAADPGLLGDDRVHPRADGRAALAAAVRAALAQ
jgi:peptidoglycan/LPS O-acetylase OafA/YrhL